MHRIFVVGCSRAGTTVLQARLARSLGLVTLPETGFFRGRLRNPALRHKRLRALSRALSQWTQTTGVTPGLGNQPGPAGRLWAARSMTASADHFRHALDRCAAACAAPGWVEKTPRHFREIPFIRRMVPGARFVFIVRPGPDNVASIHDRARRHPERFPRQQAPCYGVELWNESIRAARQEAAAKDLALVCFEDFTAYPDRCVAAIQAHILPGLTPATGDASRSGATHDAGHEPWKTGSDDPVSPQPSKWDQVFTPEEQASIRAALDEAGYRQLRFL